MSPKKKAADEVLTVPRGQVAPWPGLNPRRTFNENELIELGTSIKRDGLLQPVSVSPAPASAKPVRYWLYAGERRLRACEVMEIKRIRVIVTKIDEKTAHRLAGMENIERENLTAIEEAIWLAREMELTGMSQRQLKNDLRRSQSWIANRVRLLELPAAAQALVQDGIVAPATVRDFLLRFLKLDAELQKKLWPQLTKKIRAARKKDEVLPAPAVKIATAQALSAAGAEQLDTWVRFAGRNGGENMDAKDMTAFRKGREDRCVKSHGPFSHSREVWWTWDPAAWVEAAQKKHDAKLERRKPENRATPAEVKNPELDPNVIVPEDELSARFGHENIRPLAIVADVAAIPEGHIALVEEERYVWNAGEPHYIDEVRPHYVGPDCKALEKAWKAANETASSRAIGRKTERAVELSGHSEAELLRGMVQVFLDCENRAVEVLNELLPALGLEVPERWAGKNFVPDPKLSEVEGLLEVQVTQIATALMGMDLSQIWRRHVKETDQASARIRKKNEKAVAKWIAETVTIEIPEPTKRADPDVDFDEDDDELSEGTVGDDRGPAEVVS